MPQVVQITSGNYDGQSALVTFYPCSGGTPIVIGNVIIPYNYDADYYLGTYTLYFSGYNETCEFTIPCPTPTNTPTNSVTPTNTPTRTKLPNQTQTATSTVTPTPTKTPVCFCVRFFNTNPSKSAGLKYFDCNGGFISTSIPPSGSTQGCAVVSSITGGSSISYVQSVPCNGNSCGTATPTSTATPTPTPNSTQTPTNTRTPNPTPTNTKTPTKTPTVTPTSRPSLSICDVLFVTSENQIYSYNQSTSATTNLTNFFIGASVSGYNLDIAHTQDTLWLLGEGKIQEWFIQFSPFIANFSRIIVLGFENGDGLAAINNLRLVTSRFSDVQGIPGEIIQLNISTNTPSISNLSFLPLNRFISGDIQYTSDSNLIYTSSDLDGNSYLTQISYPEGYTQLDLDTSNSINNPSGIFQCGFNLCVFDESDNSEIFQYVTNYPFGSTPFDTVNYKVRGSSQLFDCIRYTFHDSPPPSNTPTRTVTPTISVTPTITPSNAPCCETWNFYGGMFSTGSTFSVTGCNNEVYVLFVQVFTTSSACAYNASILINNGGSTYPLPGCDCISPSPSPTPTPTVTPSSAQECNDCGIEGQGFTSEIDICGIIIYSECFYQLGGPSSSQSQKHVLSSGIINDRPYYEFSDTLQNINYDYRIYWDNVNNYWVAKNMTTNSIGGVLNINSFYPIGSLEEWTYSSGTATVCLDSSVNANFHTEPLPCTPCISLSGQGICSTTGTWFNGMVNDRYSYSFTINNNAVNTEGTIYWNNTFSGGSWVIETQEYGICSFLSINSVTPIGTPSQWVNYPGAESCICFSDSAAFGTFITEC